MHGYKANVFNAHGRIVRGEDRGEYTFEKLPSIMYLYHVGVFTINTACVS